MTAAAATTTAAAGAVALPRGARVLRCELWTPARVEDVWPFFADAHNLQELTPPWLDFRILTPKPIPMHVEARIDYRIKVRGLPMRWRTRIAAWEPMARFVDEQERGPYRLWRHTHTFEPKAGGTLLGDHVVFAPPGGVLAPLINRWFVEPDVQRIFRYRLERMVARFGGRDGRVWLEPATA